jgi:hypothetical protein
MGVARKVDALMKRFAAAAVIAIVSTASADAATVLPFITDDYAKAVAEAKTRNVPLFVDAWAPW